LSKKRKKVGAGRNAFGYKFAPAHMGADASKVERKSGLFEDIHFYVVTGDDNHTKNDLELVIKAHSGKFYQDESVVPDMRVVAGNSKIPTVYALIKRGTIDIVRPSWLLDCVERSDIIPLLPKYMLFTTDKTKEQFGKSLDKFGDSYTDEVNDAGLHELFSQLDITAPDVSDAQKRRRLVDQVEERYFLDSGLPGGIFRRKVVYLDYPPDEPGVGILEQAMRQGCCDRLDKISLLLRFHGAQVVNNVQQTDVTHLAFDEKDTTRVAGVREIFRGRSLLPRFVRAGWIEDSVGEGVLLNENSYELF